MSIPSFLSLPFRFVAALFNAVIIYLPGGFGVRLRRFYYQSKFKKCGKNLIIDVGVTIESPHLISVGDNVHFDKYCIIATSETLLGNIKSKRNISYQRQDGEIHIGNNIHFSQFCILMGHGGLSISNNVVLSAGCKLYSLTNTAYDLEDKEKIISLMPYSQANFLKGAIVLGENVWLGLGTIVMPGVTVEKNSFSVTNSVLMSSFLENSYIVGNPAKSIRKRFIATQDITQK